MPNARAVVLVSGGLDSATTLAVAIEDGYECIGLTFSYGQRHRTEIDCARRVCAGRTLRHRVIDLDPHVFKGSALTDDIEVPRFAERDPESEIPVTYVPARNTIFLSYATALAEVVGARDIFIGVNAVDYSGYPDCRPEFIDAFEIVANLGTRAGVEGSRITIRTPLLHMTKAEIIALGLGLGTDYSITSTCYSPAADGSACGECEACGLRLKGFADAGFEDPIRYQVGR